MSRDRATFTKQGSALRLLHGKTSKTSIGSDSNCSTTSGESDPPEDAAMASVMTAFTRVRPPSIVWEGVAVGPPSSPSANVTAMGAANAAIHQNYVSYNQTVLPTMGNSSSSYGESAIYQATPTSTSPTSCEPPSSYTSISTTKDLSSLECWDYSVELECLRGPDGRGKNCLLRITRILILREFIICKKYACSTCPFSLLPRVSAMKISSKLEMPTASLNFTKSVFLCVQMHFEVSGSKYGLLVHM